MNQFNNKRNNKANTYNSAQQNSPNTNKNSFSFNLNNNSASRGNLNNNSPSMSVGNLNNKSASMSVGNLNNKSPSMSVGNLNNKSASMSVSNYNSKSPSVSMSNFNSKSPSMSMSNSNSMRYNNKSPSVSKKTFNKNKSLSVGAKKNKNNNNNNSFFNNSKESTVKINKSFQNNPNMNNSPNNSYNPFNIFKKSSVNDNIKPNTTSKNAKIAKNAKNAKNDANDKKNNIKTDKGMIEKLYKKSKRLVKPFGDIKLLQDNPNIKKLLYKYFILFLIGLIIALLIYIIIFSVYYHKEKCFKKYIYGDYLKGFNVNNVCAMKVDPSIAEGNKKLQERIKENEKEVYHISNQNLTFDDAKCKCNSYGGRLATKNEITEAYNKGAEWCTYGWSDEQNAYYPTQKCTWNKLQEGPVSDKNKCGKPGVNGGHFASSNIKFGANCYGIKPKGTTVKEKKAFCKEKPYCKKQQNKNANSKMKTDNIIGFNVDKWSEYD